MGWFGAGPYYQVSTRVNGKVYTRYYGKAGVLVDFIIALEAEDRAEAEAEREARRERLEALERERREARGRAREIDGRAELVLGWLGYRRHERGRWRKRMMQAIEGPTLTEAQARREIRKLAREFARLAPGDDDDGDDGDPRDRGREKRRAEIEGELRDLGRQHPQALIDICWGDLPRLVRTTIEIGVFRENGDTFAAVEARMEQLAAELAGENPLPELRLACEAAAFAWLDFWIARAKHAAGQDTSMRPQPEPVQRQLSFASARYLKWLKAVAEIKRSSRPRRIVAAMEV
jgi:hypothetical protein